MHLSGRECGLEVSLAVVGGKWKPLILFHLMDGPRRFGELRRTVGEVSEKVLIQQLRELVADGILLRRDYQEVPPHVEYEITSFGLTLAKALAPLCEWGGENRKRVEALIKARPMKAIQPVVKPNGSAAGSLRST